MIKLELLPQLTETSSEDNPIDTPCHFNVDLLLHDVIQVVCVNEVIKTISNLFIFVLLKDSACTKSTKSTKHKQTISISLIVFACIKNCCFCCFLCAYFCFVSLCLLVSVLLVWFCLQVFLCTYFCFVSLLLFVSVLGHLESFCKNINRFEMVLMTSITHTTSVYPYRPL